MLTRNGWRREEHLHGDLQELHHKYFNVFWSHI